MVFINQLFDFFLPRFCPACNNALAASEHFVCNNCIANIKLADADLIKSEFERKFSSDKIITNFHSLFVFEKDREFQSIVHSIKYKENFRLAVFLGNLVGQKLNDITKSWSPDFLIPIPLHHLKKAERGYNQSFYLAKGISSVYEIPVKNNIIKRKRFTPSQTQLNLKQRKENVEGAFSVHKKNTLHEKNIILIDDVITTGSTISECGKILKEAGAKNVYAITSAIADI
jgi:competence protein ComFC